MFVQCNACDWSKNVPLRSKPVRARYKCHNCRQPVSSVSVFSWANWIEEHADHLDAKRLQGKLGTRRQATALSDRDISAAGLGAEMAACVIFAPWKLDEWMKHAEADCSNRGHDLDAEWFRDGRPIEIKYTERGSHLLIRPPRWTPGRMLPKYVDDSIYVLMTGKPYTFNAIGWAGRSDILDRGKLNPVPVKKGQRECWGIHADRMNPMEGLFPLLTSRRASIPTKGE